MADNAATPITSTQSGSYLLAQENWARYTYGKDRGHLDYMEQAKICEGMYLGGGEQWQQADKDVLREQKRPFYEFNEIMPSVNTALGYQIQNRMDIAFKPRGENGDLATATILSKVIMQVCDQAQMHWHETQVYGDGLIEQRGYFDLRVSFENNMKGEIQLATLDPRDVIPDPDSKAYDPDDWGDVIVTRWWTLDEIEQYYGVAARDAAEASRDIGQDFGNQDGSDVERNSFGKANTMGLYDAYGKDQNRYRIIDRQKFVYEKTDCLVYPDTGDVKVVGMMTADQVADAIAKGAVKARRMKKRIRWMVTTYSATLFDQYSPYEHFTPVPYFAYFRRGKTRGLVDNAIGPQEALNKGVSQFVHIINTSANSGWMVQENSLTNMDVEDLEKVGAQTGLVLEYKDGKAKPDKIIPNSVPTGVDRLIDRATQALKDVTVPDSMRGLQGNAVSGTAKQADQFASQQQLAVPMDNLTYTRALLAKRLVKLVQRYYDSYRIFRITETDPATGKKVEKMMEINKLDPATGSYINDVTIGQYDVVITEQPMQVTFENSQFNQATDLKKSGVAIPDAFMVRYSSLADKQELMEAMTKGAVAPPVDPTLEAKAALIAAQTRKADAETTEIGMTTLYSGIQTAQVVATIPETAQLADGLLGTVGFVDKDAAPFIPEAPAGLPIDPSIAPQNNTHPTFPDRTASPAQGIQAGIETPQNDGVAT